MLDKYIEELVKMAKAQNKLDAHLETLVKQAASEAELEAFLSKATVGELAKLAGIKLPEDVCDGCGSKMEKLGSTMQCHCGMMKKVAKTKQGSKKKEALLGTAIGAATAGEGNRGRGALYGLGLGNLGALVTGLPVTALSRGRVPFGLAALPGAVGGGLYAGQLAKKHGLEAAKKQKTASKKKTAAKKKEALLGTAIGAGTAGEGNRLRGALYGLGLGNLGGLATGLATTAISRGRVPLGAGALPGAIAGGFYGGHLAKKHGDAAKKTEKTASKKKEALLNLGTISGAMEAGEGHRMGGALAGTGGGLIGGALGAGAGMLGGGLLGAGIGALTRRPGAAATGATIGAGLGGGIGGGVGQWKGGRMGAKEFFPKKASQEKTASFAKFAKVMRTNQGDIDKALDQLEREGYTKLAFNPIQAAKTLGSKVMSSGVGQKATQLGQKAMASPVGQKVTGAVSKGIDYMGAHPGARALAGAGLGAAGGAITAGEGNRGKGALLGATLGGGAGMAAGVGAGIKQMGGMKALRGMTTQQGMQAAMNPAVQRTVAKVGLPVAAAGGLATGAMIPSQKTASVLFEVGDAAGRILAKTAEEVDISPEEVAESIEAAREREDVPGRARNWAIGGGALGGLGGAGLGYGLGRLLTNNPAKSALSRGLLRGGMAAGLGLAGGGLGAYLGSREGAEEATADRLVSMLRGRRAYQTGATQGLQAGYLQGLSQGMGGDEESEAGPQ